MPGLRSSSVAEKPVHFPGREPAEHPRLPRTATKCPDNWPPCGRGHGERSSLQGVWLGQASTAICCQPRGEQGPGHPSSQMLWGPSVAQRRFLQGPEPPGASPSRPCLRLRSKVKGSRAVSARGQAALSCWPRAAGLEGTSGLLQPPQPGPPWPPATHRQGEPEPGEGHAPLCARQVTASLAWPAWHPPHHGIFPRVTPRALPCQGSLCQDASAQAEGGSEGGLRPMTPGQHRSGVGGGCGGQPHPMPRTGRGRQLALYKWELQGEA